MLPTTTEIRNIPTKADLSFKADNIRFFSQKGATLKPYNF